MNQSQNLIEELRKKGYKITRQREAILRAFSEDGHQLLTAQEIFEKVKKSQAGTNFSTVYRNLGLFLEEQIISKVELDREAAYYELNDKKGHHHHMVCKRCGSIQTIDFCPLDRLKNDNGFIPLEHRFEIYGYCKDCINNNKEDIKDTKDKT